MVRTLETYSKLWVIQRFVIMFFHEHGKFMWYIPPFFGQVHLITWLLWSHFRGSFKITIHSPWTPNIWWLSRVNSLNIFQELLLGFWWLGRYPILVVKNYSWRNIGSLISPSFGSFNTFPHVFHPRRRGKCGRPSASWSSPKGTNFSERWERFHHP